MSDLRLIRGGMTDPAQKPATLPTVADHVLSPSHSDAEFDYKKAVEVEAIKSERLGKRHAHWMQKHNLDAAEAQKQREHEELQRVRNHDEAQRQRDHKLRMVILVFGAVGVFLSAGLLVAKGMIKEAIGLVALVGSNAATYAFGTKPSSNEATMIEIKRVLGLAAPAVGQLPALPAKAESGVVKG